MNELPRLSSKELYIIGYLFQNPSAYGLSMVKSSNGLLKRGTVYVTLHRMEEKGYIFSELKRPEKGGRGPERRVYDLTAHGIACFKAVKLFVEAYVPQIS